MLTVLAGSHRLCVEFSETGGRIGAAVGNVEDFGWFYACWDVGIANQAHSGGGACVANGEHYGAIKYPTLDLCFCESFSAVCAFLLGVFFLSACIARSALGITAPGSSVFVYIVSGELKHDRDSVYCCIGYVIESVRFRRGYEGL